MDELTKAHVHFVGALEENALLGCGAVRIMLGSYGEIKPLSVFMEKKLGPLPNPPRQGGS